jgi:2-isopropylmalate synthase
MTSEIEIYDTTLRDGTQGHGISFSVADKLRIADRLDAFGVHYIEGGWPGSPRPTTRFSSSSPRRRRSSRSSARPRRCTFAKCCRRRSTRT